MTAKNLIIIMYTLKLNDYFIEKVMCVKSITMRTAYWKKKLFADRYFYLMSLPAIIWFIIFSYLPMIGIAMAFFDYIPGIPLTQMRWVGMDNFMDLFTDKYFFRALKNTCIISSLRIIICLLASVTLAILFNEIRQKWFRVTAQAVSYVPYFISWVIVAIFFSTLFKSDGGINTILAAIGLSKISMGDADQFRAIVIVSDIWKGVGYNSLLFTAAISGIDPTLYESLKMDGGGRWAKIRHIILPSISFSIIVVLILWIGAFVNMGADQMFNLYSPSVYETGDILDTYIYRIAFSSGSRYGVATAAGLF